jgi:hypothetical protein
MGVYEEISKEEVNMDEMKLKLSTRFMKNMVSKLISKMIYKKLGYKVNIQLKELDVSIIDGETHINTDVELKLESSEFMKIVKSLESQQ